MEGRSLAEIERLVACRTGVPARHVRVRVVRQSSAFAEAGAVWMWRLLRFKEGASRASLVRRNGAPRVFLYSNREIIWDKEKMRAARRAA
jgi:hypothetical protein